MTPADPGDRVDHSGNGYVDIRALMTNYERRSCWNCGWEYWQRLDSARKICCDVCFMGLRGRDGTDSDYVTDDGYVDYRKLWYGDVSLEEAHRRYEDNTDNSRKKLEFERYDIQETTA